MADKAERMVEAIKSRLKQYEEERTAEIQSITAEAVAEISRRVEEVITAVAITEPGQLKSLIDKGGTVRQIMVSTDSEDQRQGGQRGLLTYLAAQTKQNYAYRRELEVPELDGRKRVRLTIIAEPIED